MHTDHTVRVDQDVAPQLIHITLRTVKPPAAQQQFEIRPTRGQTVNVPPPTAVHPVGRVQRPSLIDEKRPAQLRFTLVDLRQGADLERHNEDLDAQRLHFVFMLPQLRQMLPARQSPEVAVEHQEQPIACILVKPMEDTGGVLHLETDAMEAFFAFHALHPSWKIGNPRFDCNCRCASGGRGSLLRSRES